MNNAEIISRIAVTSGIYTVEEIKNMIAQGKEIPLHTFKGWKDRGMTVRKGEHGIACKLWKMKGKKKTDDDNTEKDTDTDSLYYLTKSYLFTKNQVEKGEEDG